MLKWYKNLYVGSSIEEKKDKIIWNVNHKVGMLSTYVVAIATNEKNLIDIFSSNLLLQKGFRKSCPLILGIAGDYDEAVRITIQMIDEIYQETGGFKVRKYFYNE